ncbi:hypothetical protein Ahia01_001205600, partial [Argonauta hians]
VADPLVTPHLPVMGHRVWQPCLPPPSRQQVERSLHPPSPSPSPILPSPSPVPPPPPPSSSSSSLPLPPPSSSLAAALHPLSPSPLATSSPSPLLSPLPPSSPPLPQLPPSPLPSSLLSPSLPLSPSSQLPPSSPPLPQLPPSPSSSLPLSLSSSSPQSLQVLPNQHLLSDSQILDLDETLVEGDSPVWVPKDDTPEQDTVLEGPSGAQQSPQYGTNTITTTSNNRQTPQPALPETRSSFSPSFASAAAAAAPVVLTSGGLSTTPAAATPPPSSSSSAAAAKLPSPPPAPPTPSTSRLYHSTPVQNAPFSKSPEAFLTPISKPHQSGSRYKRKVSPSSSASKAKRVATSKASLKLKRKAINNQMKQWCAVADNTLVSQIDCATPDNSWGFKISQLPGQHNAIS